MDQPVAPVAKPKEFELVREHTLTDEVAENILNVARETKTCKIIIDPRKLSNNVMVKFGLHKGTLHFGSVQEAVNFCKRLGITNVEGPYSADILRGRQKVLGLAAINYFNRFIPQQSMTPTNVARSSRRREYLLKATGRL